MSNAGHAFYRHSIVLMEMYEIDIIVVMIVFLFAYRIGRLLSLSLFLQLLRFTQSFSFFRVWNARYRIVYLLLSAVINMYCLVFAIFDFCQMMDFCRMNLF